MSPTQPQDEQPINSETPEPQIGEHWTNMGTGRVYRWDVELWQWTGETVPVPFLGEFRIPKGDQNEHRPSRA